MVWSLVFAILIRILMTYFSEDSIIAVREDKIVPVNNTAPIRLDQGTMFAIGIEELDLRYEKAFTFRLNRMQIEKRSRSITEKVNTGTVTLVPCTKTVW
jgi:hypothetical protein